jgi:hypothetical protein
MISQLFILSPRGDVIIKKEFRCDVHPGLFFLHSGLLTTSIEAMNAQRKPQALAHNTRCLASLPLNTSPVLSTLEPDLLTLNPEL